MGLFESLYEMKYGEIMDGDAYAEGIPQEEFETLMMEYLPVTREELRTWAEYDRETGTYLWSGWGREIILLRYLAPPCRK